MRQIGLSACLLATLGWMGCGSSETDFYTPDRGGAQPGGSGGAPVGASGGAPAGTGGAGGSSVAGSTGGQLGGSGGSDTAGVAGSGVGAAGLGAAGMGGVSGAASGGAGGRIGGTGGTGPSFYSCGSLMCVADQQYCVNTLPEVSGGPTQRMCLPFQDSCSTLDCSCFCNPPQQSPCGPAGECTCMGEKGRLQITCRGG